MSAESFSLQNVFVEIELKRNMCTYSDEAQFLFDKACYSYMYVGICNRHKIWQQQCNDLNVVVVI